ncbi:MAG TPA: hypothetical protein VNE42_02605 [Acidimicrobiales bacterium]|nr:hypothetical protein [Acidimicrobiales bacterium]
MADLTRNREFRLICSEIFDLFRQTGYVSSDITVEFRLEDDVLIWGVGGEDETAVAVMRGILKVICTEHGIDVAAEMDA